MRKSPCISSPTAPLRSIDDRRLYSNSKRMLADVCLPSAILAAVGRILSMMCVYPALLCKHYALQH